MGQANSSLLENHTYRYPTIAEEAAASKRSQALWRAKLRKPNGKELPPEPYRELKLHEICTSDALRSHLAAVGASTPSCVHADKLPKEKAKVAKGRFFFYAGSSGRHIAEIFTDKELDNLVEDGDKLRAREMPVFDREGRRYGFDFMYYDRDFYQLAGPGAEFERFMVDNNVVRDVVELGKKMSMQIFTFRSPKLLPEGKGFQGHPDGALGMIILFSEMDDDEYADYIKLVLTAKEMDEWKYKRCDDEYADYKQKYGDDDADFLKFLDNDKYMDPFNMGSFKFLDDDQDTDYIEFLKSSWEKAFTSHADYVKMTAKEMVEQQNQKYDDEYVIYKQKYGDEDAEPQPPQPFEYTSW